MFVWVPPVGFVVVVGIQKTSSEIGANQSTKFPRGAHL